MSVYVAGTEHERLIMRDCRVQDVLRKGDVFFVLKIDYSHKPYAAYVMTPTVVGWVAIYLSDDLEVMP